MSHAIKKIGEVMARTVFAFVEWCNDQDVPTNYTWVDDRLTATGTSWYEVTLGAHYGLRISTVRPESHYIIQGPDWEVGLHLLTERMFGGEQFRHLLKAANDETGSIYGVPCDWLFGLRAVISAKTSVTNLRGFETAIMMWMLMDGHRGEPMLHYRGSPV